MRKDESILDKNTVISMIDHAVLKPEATDNDVLRECEIVSVMRKIVNV